MSKEKKEEEVTPSDLGADEVQAKVDEEQEQGFRGTEVDKTPNENYTVAGVLANKPTPETESKDDAK